MKSRIIIVGKGGSGKDYLKSKLVAKGYSADVSVTTRPKRDGEIPGETYLFVSEEEFFQMIDNGSFHQHKEFNGWYYGTTELSWTTSDVFIMTPSGVRDLSQEDRDSSFIIFLDIPLETRKERMSKRNDADSMYRRISADLRDFTNFTEYDLRITNHDF